VATDDPLVARMLEFALDQMGLTHRFIESGSVLLHELLTMPASGELPLVIMDIDLPGVDGHAILERVGIERPDAFLIIVLSAHGDESVRIRSLLGGALDHVTKPFNVRVLMAKIQRCLALSARLRRIG
jgi:DNA-binding response OmpR family regulator